MILQKTLKPFIIMLVIIIFNFSTQAQQNPYGVISIASPTAASLGKYGDIPVNYHTGIPQINIPLYTIKEGTLILPISLSYHASGLKVMETSSWVGAGWSLNAGGVITRTVMGGPDEAGTMSGLLEDNGHFSDYGYNNYLYANNEEDWQGVSAGRKDGEPDLFFFNFAGYSGKFYFRDDRTPVLVPQQDLKIEYYFPADNGGNFSSQGYNIQAFTITTPNGDKYYFGNSAGLTGTAPIEITNAYSDKTGLSGGAVISSWYLNKIESADMQFSISLIYQTENYGYFTTAMYPIDGNSYNPNQPYEYNLVKNIINGVRLSQINFSNGYVKFIAGVVRADLSDASQSYLSDPVNQNTTSLGSIQIFDNGIGYKNYKFYYGYFADNTSSLTGYYSTSNYNSFMQADRKRLKLDSLQEVSADGTINLPPYEFSYYSGLVPRRLSFGIDHWGFINEVTSNQKLIPTYTTTNGGSATTVSGADRDANSSMLNGSLQKITYPTGGYTKFDFEPNDTYITYPKDEFQYLASSTIGYDGSNTPETVIASPNTSSYQINTSNNSAYDAQAVIKNSSGTIIQTFWILANSTDQTTYTFPSSGTYTIVLSFTWGSNAHPLTGTGAQISFGQWVTVTASENAVVGGLRIKTITHNDGVSSNNNIVTTYSYNDNGGNSTGILYSRPVYVQQVRNDLVQSVGFWTTNGFQSNSLNPSGCPVLGLYLKSGGTMRPMESTQGYHIGYSRVKVSQTGNGYSIYNYYINNTGYAPPPNGDVCIRTVSTAATCDPNTPNYPPAPLSSDYKRGELYYEQHYDNNGKLLKDVYYYPQYDTAFFMTTPAFIVASRTNFGGSQMLLGTRYNLSTYRKTKTMVVETDYSQTSGSLTKTTTTYYGSPYHYEPTRTVVTTSTADSLISTLKYTYDFRVAPCDAISDCSSSYNSSCSSCLTTYNNSRNSCNGASPCLSTAYLNYLQCQTNARISYVNCRHTNFTAPVNAYKTAHDNAKSSADANLKPILQLQDEYINTPIEINQWRNGNLLQAKYTNYDFAANPSAFVYPSKNQSINLAAPSATFSAATVSGSTVSKDSRYEDESFYTFNAGNPMQLKGRDGVTKSYIWGYANTLPIAQVINAASNEIYFSSFEEGGWMANMQYDNNFSHCGDNAGKIVKTTTGELVCFSNTWLNISLSSTKKFHYSGWVFSNGPTADIYLFMKRAGETGPYSYIDFITTATTNKWVYLEKDFTVPADVTQLKIRVDNNGGGTVWFDDIRLYPSDAQMTTYTYNPLVGMTSQSDINNRCTYYEYDALGRLSVIRDQDKNVVKKICYNYAGHVSNCTVAAPISLTLTNVSGVTGFTATYTNVSTGVPTTFTIPASGSSTVTLQPGTYNLLVSRAAGNANYIYTACGITANCGTVINNLNVSETSCNALSIDSIF